MPSRPQRPAPDKNTTQTSTTNLPLPLAIDTMAELKGPHGPVWIEPSAVLGISNPLQQKKLAQLRTVVHLHGSSISLAMTPAEARDCLRSKAINNYLANVQPHHQHADPPAIRPPPDFDESALMHEADPAADPCLDCEEERTPL